MSHTRKYASLTTAGIFFIGFFMVTTNNAISIALAEIVEGLVGESNLLFGLLGSMLFLGNIVMIFPMVKLSDRIGRKTTLVLSLSIAAIGVFLLYFATQYWMFVMLQFFIGLNSVVGVVSALIYDSFPKELRGGPLSFYTIGVVMGFLAGSIIGGPIYAWLEKYAFLFITSFLVLCIVNVLLTIRDPPPDERINRGDELHTTSTWKYLTQNKKLIGLLIQNLFNYICFTGGGSYAVYVIFTHLKTDPKIGGCFLIPCQIVEIILFYVIGKKAKNFDKVYKILLVTGIIILGFTIGLYFMESAAFFSLTLAFFGVALASSMQSADVLSHNLIPPEHKSNMVSIYRLVGLIGSTIGPMFFGLLSQGIWIFAPAVFVVLGMFIMVFIYFKWVKN